MPCPHQRAQEVRELFAQFQHVMALGFEQLQQRAQVRRRELRNATVVRLVPMDELMHLTTEVIRVQLAEMRLTMVMQKGTRDRV